MSPKIFLNLPVADIPASMNFYESAGFELNPDFCDQSALCFKFSEEIYVMLLSHDKFNEFISRPLAQTTSSIGSIYALEVAGREEVDALMSRVLAAGAKEPNDARDYGFMYQRSFEDLDGHLWEVFYMDMSALPWSTEDWTKGEVILTECSVSASAERFWDCLTNPAHVMNWNFAADSWHCPAASNALHPQGKFSYTMAARDGSMQFDFSGTFTRIITNRMLEFVLDDGRRVRIVIKPEGNRLKVVQHFEPEKMNPHDLQQGGWQSILNNLKAYAEK